jgi:hypothetical protein
MSERESTAEVAPADKHSRDWRPQRNGQRGKDGAVVGEGVNNGLDGAAMEIGAR